MSNSITVIMSERQRSHEGDEYWEDHTSDRRFDSGKSSQKSRSQSSDFPKCCEIGLHRPFRGQTERRAFSVPQFSRHILSKFLQNGDDI
jgi:hypothetical protein